MKKALLRERFFFAPSIFATRDGQPQLLPEWDEGLPDY